MGAHRFLEANKRELVNDLMMKAKQVEYLINSLPEPEPEEEQVRLLSMTFGLKITDKT